MQYEHLSFVEAIYELAQRVGVDVPLESVVSASPPQHPGAPAADVYSILAQATQAYQTQLQASPQALAYLEHRGIDIARLHAFQLGYAPAGWQFLRTQLGSRIATPQALLDAGLAVQNEQGNSYDRFRDRMMFPVHDRRGRVIAFGARTLSAEGQPKYLNSPETAVYHKGKELYGLYQARQALRRLDSLLVVEGYMDVLALVQRGIANVVATSGTATTEAQVEQLFRASTHIIFCFDGDSAGREAAWKALKVVLPKLREGHQVSFLFVAENEDPDSWIRLIGAAAFQHAVQQAMPLAEFLFERVQQQHQINLQSIEGRVRLVELLRPLLSNTPYIIRQGILLRLAEVVKIDFERIITLIQGHNEAPPQPVVSPTVNSNHPLPRSPLRLAIALLLQHPELAQVAGPPERWPFLAMPGILLLKKILELLQSRPKLNSGALLEYWRGSEQAPYLAKLLQWPLNIPETGVVAEFEGVLRHLDIENLRERTAQLSQTPLHLLSPQEKEELKASLELEAQLKSAKH